MLLLSENRTMLASVVLSQYTRFTYRETDRRHIMTIVKLRNMIVTGLISRTLGQTVFLLLIGFVLVFSSRLSEVD